MKPDSVRFSPDIETIGGGNELTIGASTYEVFDVDRILFQRTREKAGLHTYHHSITRFEKMEHVKPELIAFFEWQFGKDALITEEDGRLKLMVTPDGFMQVSEQANKIILYAYGSKEFVDNFKTKISRRRGSEIVWYHLNRRGSYDSTTVGLDIPEVVEDEFYPFLSESPCKPNGVEDYYDKFLEASSSILLLMGPPGVGKCFAKGTPILMYDGSVRAVEDVHENDFVMGNDSTARKVHGCTFGKEKMFRIIPVKGGAFEVNESHILSVKYEGRTVNLSVKEYLTKSNDFKTRSVLYRTGVDFPPQELTLPPYLLGMWLGDGSTNKPVIHNPDVEVIDYLSQYAFSIGYELYDVSGENRCPSWSITKGHGQHHKHHIITDALREYGILGDKDIPRSYLINSKENRLELLAGLLDSDGYLFHNTFEITQKSEKLAKNILFLARSLGFAAYMSSQFKTCQTGRGNTYHRVSISGDTSKIPTKIPRKKASNRLQNKNVLHTGFTIEPVGDGEYYGFAVDGNHLFCLGDFTVVHNTAFVRNLIKMRDMKAAISYDPKIMLSENFLVEFLTNPEHDLLVIEDADVLLSSREFEGNSDMNKFLNIGDGLIKFPRKKIIFTTNLISTSKIDEALVRPGRCFDILHFRPLNLTEANAVGKKLGMEPFTQEQNYPLSKIFNRNGATPKKRMGF